MESSDSMESGWSVASAREEIAATRLLLGESVDVILETIGRDSTTDLT